MLNLHDGNPILALEKNLNGENSQYRIIGGTVSFTYEKGIIQQGKNQQLNTFIQEIEEFNGQIRSLSYFDSDISHHSKNISLSYFRVNEEGIPIVAIEKNTDISIIKHEFQHFRDWISLRENLRQNGMNAKEAGIKAYQELGSFHTRKWTEKNAVRAELKGQNIKLENATMLERSTYPERAAIIELLTLHRANLTHPGKDEFQAILKYMDSIIKKALFITNFRKRKLSNLLKDSNITNKERKIFEGQLKELERSNYITDILMIRENDKLGLYDLFQERLSLIQSQKPKN